MAAATFQNHKVSCYPPFRVQMESIGSTLPSAENQLPLARPSPQSRRLEVLFTSTKQLTQKPGFQFILNWASDGSDPGKVTCPLWVFIRDQPTHLLWSGLERITKSRVKCLEDTGTLKS